MSANGGWMVVGQQLNSGQLNEYWPIVVEYWNQCSRQAHCSCICTVGARLKNIPLCKCCQAEYTRMSHVLNRQNHKTKTPSLQMYPSFMFLDSCTPSRIWTQPLFQGRLQHQCPRGHSFTTSFGGLLQEAAFGIEASRSVSWKYSGHYTFWVFFQEALVLRCTSSRQLL